MSRPSPDSATDCNTGLPETDSSVPRADGNARSIHVARYIAVVDGRGEPYEICADRIDDAEPALPSNRWASPSRQPVSRVHARSATRSPPACRVRKLLMAAF